MSGPPSALTCVASEELDLCLVTWIGTELVSGLSLWARTEGSWDSGKTNHLDSWIHFPVLVRLEMSTMGTMTWMSSTNCRRIDLTMKIWVKMQIFPCFAVAVAAGHAELKELGSEDLEITLLQVIGVSLHDWQG